MAHEFRNPRDRRLGMSATRSKGPRVLSLQHLQWQWATERLSPPAGRGSSSVCPRRIPRRARSSHWVGAGASGLAMCPSSGLPGGYSQIPFCSLVAIWSDIADGRHAMHSRSQLSVQELERHVPRAKSFPFGSCRCNHVGAANGDIKPRRFVTGPPGEPSKKAG